MSMILTGEELTLLTGKKRKTAQVMALKAMHIAHIVRGDGMPIVSRNHVEYLLDGKIPTGLESKNDIQPDWEAMNNAKKKKS